MMMKSRRCECLAFISLQDLLVASSSMFFAYFARVHGMKNDGFGKGTELV